MNEERPYRKQHDRISWEDRGLREPNHVPGDSERRRAEAKEYGDRGRRKQFESRRPWNEHDRFESNQRRREFTIPPNRPAHQSGNPSMAPEAAGHNNDEEYAYIVPRSGTYFEHDDRDVWRPFRRGQKKVDYDHDPMGRDSAALGDREGFNRERGFRRGGRGPSFPLRDGPDGHNFRDRDDQGQRRPVRSRYGEIVETDEAFPPQPNKEEPPPRRRRFTEKPVASDSDRPAGLAVQRGSVAWQQDLARTYNDDRPGGEHRSSWQSGFGRGYGAPRQRWEPYPSRRGQEHVMDHGDPKGRWTHDMFEKLAKEEKLGAGSETVSTMDGVKGQEEAGVVEDEQELQDMIDGEDEGSLPVEDAV